MKYLGITYPKIFDNRLIQKFWKRFFCPSGFHLFDEVYIDDYDVLNEYHYLYCDACDEMLLISKPNK